VSHGGGGTHRDYQLAHYDAHYPRHATAVRQQLAHPVFRAWNDRIAERVLDHAPPGREAGRPLRVYEAGCGEGLLASAFQRVAARRSLPLAYTGSDLSPAGLGIAREAVPGGEFVAGDATEVTASLPPGSQDLVVCKNLLHHMDDPAAFLRAAAHAAGPEGRVAIVEARRGCIPFVLVTGLFFTRREKHYFKGRRRNLVRPVEAAGLRPVHTEVFSWFPFELFFAIRVPWFRRLVPTDNARTLARIAAADDWLAAKLPWSTCYDIWLTRPSP
jgi:SAM-dependent methyltransferase